MIRPELSSVLAALRSKGYKIYDSPDIDWNLNLVGVRSRSLKPDKFDDWLLVFHRFGGHWDVRHYQITTDPSSYYLRNPISSHGTAVLKEGQYLGAYTLDTHRRGRKGAHRALCQRLGDVVIYRDSNGYGILDMNPAKEQRGKFGINIHRGPRNGEWAEENPYYAAGCQVFADDRKFDEFLLACENAAAAFGNRFTYTLLNERDL